MLTLFTAAAVILYALWHLIDWLQFRRRYPRLPPGPAWRPLIGNTAMPTGKNASVHGGGGAGALEALPHKFSEAREFSFFLRLTVFC